MDGLGEGERVTMKKNEVPRGGLIKEFTWIGRKVISYTACIYGIIQVSALEFKRKLLVAGMSDLEGLRPSNRSQFGPVGACSAHPDVALPHR